MADDIPKEVTAERPGLGRVVWQVPDDLHAKLDGGLFEAAQIVLGQVLNTVGNGMKGTDPAGVFLQIRHALASVDTRPFNGGNTRH